MLVNLRAIFLRKLFLIEWRFGVKILDCDASKKKVRFFLGLVEQLDLIIAHFRGFRFFHTLASLFHVHFFADCLLK